MSGKFDDFFEQSFSFNREVFRLNIRLARNQSITLEEISAPAPEQKYAPYREVNPASGEGQLLKSGWRLISVPYFDAAVDTPSRHSELSWHNPPAWIAVGPNEDNSARRFECRRAALWWAQEQAGLRKAS